MTIDQVKRDLPDVPVKVGKRRYMAKLSGRLCPDATVTLSYVTHAAPRQHLRGRPWHDWHFAWETVARAVTTGDPLILD